MILPRVPATYSPALESERNRSLQLADRGNRKIGVDVEIGQEKLILRSPNGTRYNITVDNSGVITATAL